MKKIPKLILMFTHNDVTVPDAIDYFNQVKDLPVDYFGFKEVGLPEKDMRQLNDMIHENGFESFLEIVEYEEDKILELTRQAVDIKFDYLMGTIYYPSILDIIKNSSMQYFPFCGKIYNRPSILGGTIKEIVEDAKRIEAEGVHGFDLLAYRYVYPYKVSELVLKLNDAVEVPIVSAGSINSIQRLEETKNQGVWGLTIGGAFFEKRFMPGGSYRDNVIKVLKKLNDPV